MTKYIPLLCVVLLAACVTTPKPEANRDLRFTHLGVQPVDVLSIRVARTYQPPLSPPILDHELSPSPMTAMTQWANDRFRARGGVTTAQFIIDDASLVAEALQTDKGFTGIFKIEQADRFVIRLAGRFVISDQAGQTLGIAQANVERFQTAPEGQSLNERDEMLFKLTEAAMADFDSRMIAAMRKHTSAWVR